MKHHINLQYGICFDLFIQFRSSINFEIQSRLHQKIHHDSEVDEVDLRQDFEQVNRKSVVLLIPFFPAVNYVLRTVDNWVDWHLCRKEKIPIKLVKQHMSSPTVFIGVRVTRSLIFCVMHWIPFVCHFGLFVTIVLSVLRFTDSDYPFGTFKLFTINKTSWIYNFIPSS